MTDTQKYLRLLFRRGEFVCLASTVQDVITCPIENLNVTTKHKWISLNPYKPYATRSIAHLSEYRNILIECDEISLQEQSNLMARVGLPYTTQVYSGGKSYHYVIALYSGVDYKTYTRLFESIYAVLDNLSDSMVKSPDTFTRIPEGIRQGRTQKLVSTRERISLYELESWLGNYSDKIKTKQMRKKNDFNGNSNNNSIGSIHTKGNSNGLKSSTLALISTGACEGYAGRHEAMLGGIFDMLYCKYDIQEIYNTIRDKFLIHHEDKSEAELERLCEWANERYMGEQ